MRTRIAAALLLASTLPAQTVEREMTADRPGFRNSTHLVGPGVVQVENGVSYTRERTLAMQPEIRIGTFSWLELRLLADSVVLRRGGDAAGTSALQPGIKFPLFNKVLGTRVVAILKSTVPSGHTSQTTGGYEPGAEVIWEHVLTDDFSLSGALNMTRLKSEHFIWNRAASISANQAVSKRLRTFGDVYAVSPREPGAGNIWAVDAGIMRVVGEHLMLDASAGRSVHGPRDWFVAVGFSLRSRVPFR